MICPGIRLYSVRMQVVEVFSILVEVAYWLIPQLKMVI